jgi:hypothetical protein
VSAREVRRKLLAGDPALFVCAYEEDEMFQIVRLDGAIPYSALVARLPSLRKDHEIIFY